MGASVYLRHIVISRDKSADIESLEQLLNETIAQKELQSNILYKHTGNHLIVEYFSKSIPPLIYKGLIFDNKDILTIYSSDQGDKDSFILFGPSWFGDFNYEPCYYEFDHIEITGSESELAIFQEYLYLDNNTKFESEKWERRTFGKLVLQTISERSIFSGRFPHYEIIEDKEVFESTIENEGCWISSMECEDKVLDQRLKKLLLEMFYHPEYYENEIKTVKFSNQGQIIFKAKFDVIKDEWQFFHNSDLWRMISNHSVILELRKIAYH